MFLSSQKVGSILLGLMLCGLGNVAGATSPTNYDLKLDTNMYQTATLNAKKQAVTYRAYKDLVYVSHPVDVNYEKMNIYVPEAYFKNGTINGYTAKTAPIFMPNGVGGYMPGEAGTPSEHGMFGDNQNEPNAILQALEHGYVVAAPAIRGRTLTGANGEYTGKAPACIVDYKAAVRYLRYNKDLLPAGDTEKIISNGTSAGGALSALLGATGNNPDYKPYLKALGAANTRDDIFAAMAYCPITNLDHADMAYEWVFNGVNEYHQRQMPDLAKMGKDALKNLPPMGKGAPQNLPALNGKLPAGLPAGAANNRPANAPLDAAAVKMTSAQMAVSPLLKQRFPDYVNLLGLHDKNGKPLTLDEDGNGSFKDYLESFYIASAQSALDKGEDISKLDWLVFRDGRPINMDLHKYALYATRLKAAPAFDALDLSSGENSLFGTATMNTQHFTSFSLFHSSTGDTVADSQIVKMMNPMNYIGNDDNTIVAKHWRIRHGAKDRDTSLAIPLLLALKLENAGASVDFASPWNRGHAGDYDLPELFAWIDSICLPQK
jgi:hypothetical protein